MTWFLRKGAIETTCRGVNNLFELMVPLKLEPCICGGLLVPEKSPGMTSHRCD